MAALILALVWITASHLLLVWLLIRATNRPRKRPDEDEEMPLKDLATVQTDTDAMVDSVQTEKENGGKVKDESIEEVKLEKKEEKKEKEEHENEEEG